jgi:hypothetical protein
MAQRELGAESKIKTLNNGGATDDGLDISFDIVTADGKAHPFWVSGSDDLEMLVATVIRLSQNAAGPSGKMKVPTGPQPMHALPITAIAAAVTPGRAPTEGLIHLHLGTFHLAFALSANLLQEVHDSLGRLLQPSTRKPN